MNCRKEVSIIGEACLLEISRHRNVVALESKCGHEVEGDVMIEI